MNTTVTERNYVYFAAGRAWLVPELRLVRLPDSTLAIPASEILRVGRAIANEICGSEEPLTAAELEFLCGLTAVAFSEVADAVGVHRSALTRWRASESTMREATSHLLKKWFWFRNFGNELGDIGVPLHVARDDVALLRFAHDRALSSQIVSEVYERREAS